MMRVTELQSVIAELTRKLKEATGNKIIEEDEDVEESQCSSDLDAEGGMLMPFLISVSRSSKCFSVSRCLGWMKQLV